MNKTDKRIAFLLGAGFSVAAGLPTANAMNNRIVSEIYNRIRKPFKEWEDGMLQGFIWEKVLLDYDESYSNFNYEQFFDLLTYEKMKCLDKDKLLSFIERGMYGYYWRCSNENDTMKDDHAGQIQSMFQAIIKKCDNYSNVVESVWLEYQSVIAQSLIGDTKNGKIEDFNPCYKGFVNILSCYVNKGYVVDIYTLNHDLFLESLLSHTALNDKVSNGFGGVVQKINNVDNKTFDVIHYNNSIRIYKLHGSIDIYELSFAEKETTAYIQTLNGYCATNAFMMNEKQFASILPLFLTGKNLKEKEYDKEPYKSMLNELRINVGGAEKLIIIGYSGNDKGINEILYNSSVKWNNTYVVGPSAGNHPFVKDKQAKAINKRVESLTCKDVDM